MLIDNIRDYNLIDGIDTQTAARSISSLMGKDNGRDGNLDIVTGFFTIKGLNFIKEVMADDTTFRLVLSKMAGYSPEDDGKCAIDLLSEDNGITAMLNLSEDARKAVEFLSSDKVAIRAITNAFCHAKSYIFKDKNQPAFDSYITGSSNLTDAGLGLIPTHNVELNVAEMGHSDTFQSHQKWFDELWKNIKDNEMIPCDPKDPTSKKIPVKQYFINLISDTILRSYTPEDIYYKILFEYFKSEVEVDNPEMQKDISLLQNTVIWKDTLFDYQQKGVISLIQMLEKYGGAILADAVGLGKTFSALAVMWYFQNKGYTVAVFCPKKLQQNWEQYQWSAGSRFEKDCFHYVVNFHTDLQGDRLSNKEKGNLAYLQRQKKLLVVIDESHNLRNDDSERYKMLLNDIIAQNDDSRIVKVLQLSATPINNKLTDVRNQFNLIGHGRDNAFDEAFEIESLRYLFQNAQTKYNLWTEQESRTLGGLISKLPTKFFNLTDRLIVARTRKMVEETTESDLGFPEQKEPVNIYRSISELGHYHSFQEIYDALLAANLTAYKPSVYMGKTNKKDWQDDTYRELSLVKMMAVLFTKRLESSWFACLTTIEKVLKVHEETLRRVNGFLMTKESTTISISTDDVVSEEDEDEVTGIITSLDKGRINLAEMKDILKFKESLEYDIEKLKEFYENICIFQNQFESGKRLDDKLEELKRIIREKQQKPNKKMVIFTAFSDTAEYLYAQLVKDPSLKTRMACVTGSRTFTPEGSTNKFGPVLQRFAPKSKLYKEKDWTDYYALQGDDFITSHYNDETQKWNVSYEEWKKLLPSFKASDAAEMVSNEIDILIATDCLSEGQNLQDADLVVNYDIHWNPVRLIQRFGRIDRIGSDNATIGSVNFWPADDYDEVLKLANRINDRMAAMALVGAETLDVTPKIKQTMADNPLIDENTQKLLKQMQNKISDIEQPQTVTLANLSLETFRQDLLEFLNSRKDFFLSMPFGAFSGFKIEENLFDDIPESLVALVGYPHRKPYERDKKYEKLYLICQPVEEGAHTAIEEVNIAQILDFLRDNKLQPTFLPEWIETPDKERVDKISDVLKGWMKAQLIKDANSIMKDPRQFLTSIKAKQSPSLLDEKYRFENFDLVLWEYISNN